MTDAERKTIPDGTVLGWVILDPDTLEQCLRCESRDEGRDMARQTGGVLAKLVKAH